MGNFGTWERKGLASLRCAAGIFFVVTPSLILDNRMEK